MPTYILEFDAYRRNAGWVHMWGPGTGANDISHLTHKFKAKNNSAAVKEVEKFLGKLGRSTFRSPLEKDVPMRLLRGDKVVKSRRFEQMKKIGQRKSTYPS